MGLLPRLVGTISYYALVVMPTTPTPTPTTTTARSGSGRSWPTCWRRRCRSCPRPASSPSCSRVRSAAAFLSHSCLSVSLSLCRSVEGHPLPPSAITIDGCTLPPPYQSLTHNPPTHTHTHTHTHLTRHGATALKYQQLQGLLPKDRRYDLFRGNARSRTKDEAEKRAYSVPLCNVHCATCNNKKTNRSPADLNKNKTKKLHHNPPTPKKNSAQEAGGPGEVRGQDAP